MRILNHTVGFLMAVVLGVDPVFAAGSAWTASSNLPKAIGTQALYQSQAVNAELVQGFDARQDRAGRSIASHLRQDEGAEIQGLKKKTAGRDLIFFPGYLQDERAALAHMDPLAVEPLPDGSVVVGIYNHSTHLAAIYRPDGSVIPLLGENGERIMTLTSLAVDERGHIFVTSVGKDVREYSLEGTYLRSIPHPSGETITFRGLAAYGGGLYGITSITKELYRRDLTTGEVAKWPVPGGGYAVQLIGVNPHTHDLYLLTDRLVSFNVERQSFKVSGEIPGFVHGGAIAVDDAGTVYVAGPTADTRHLILIFAANGDAREFALPPQFPIHALAVDGDTLLIGRTGGFERTALVDLWKGSRPLSKRFRQIEGASPHQPEGGDKSLTQSSTYRTAPIPDYGISAADSVETLDVLNRLPETAAEFVRQRPPALTTPLVDLVLHVLDTQKLLTSTPNADERRAMAGRLASVFEAAGLKPAEQNKRVGLLLGASENKAQAVGEPLANKLRRAQKDQHNAKPRVQLIGLFDVHVYPSRLVATLDRIAEETARQGRRMYLHIEGVASTDGVLELLQGPDGASDRKAFLKGAGPIYRDYMAQLDENRSSWKHRVEVDRQLVTPEEGHNRPYFEYMKSHESIVSRHPNVQPVSEAHDDPGWRAEVIRRIRKFDFKHGPARTASYEVLETEELESLGMSIKYHESRDQAVARQILNLADEDPDGVIVIVRGAAHYKLFNRLPPGRFQTLVAVTAAVDPRIDGALSWLMSEWLNNGIRPATALQRKILLSNAKAAELNVELMKMGQIKDFIAAQRWQHERMREVLPDELLAEVLKETPPVRPFIHVDVDGQPVSAKASRPAESPERQSDARPLHGMSGSS